MNNAIVIGGNHHNTLGILRSLGEKGIFSILILVDSSPQPYVKFSRYISSLHHIQEWNEIPDLLLSIIGNLNYKPVVISCADPASYVLDSRYDDLSNLCFLPLGKKQGDIIKAMDKCEMTRIAEEVNLNTPHSFYFTDELPLDYPVQFPIIAKPLTSVSGSKSDIKVLDNINELNSYIREKSNLKIQYQEYIKKEIEFQLIGCSLNAGEQVIIPGASIILRQPKETNTGFLRYSSYKSVCDEHLINRCRLFLKEIGYSGLFSMEFLKDSQGNFYFMEINMRNDGNSICVTESGMNLPYIWYASNQGLEYTDEVQKQIREVLVMPEFVDIYIALRTYKIGLLNWIKDVRRTDRFMEYDSNDKRPFFVLLKQYLKRAVCKLFK